MEATMQIDAVDDMKTAFQYHTTDENRARFFIQLFQLKYYYNWGVAFGATSIVHGEQQNNLFIDLEIKVATKVTKCRVFTCQ